jgi:hypothetical protein
MAKVPWSFLFFTNDVSAASHLMFSVPGYLSSGEMSQGWVSLTGTNEVTCIHSFIKLQRHSPTSPFQAISH